MTIAASSLLDTFAELLRGARQHFAVIRAEFEAELAARLRRAYPPGPHGTVFPFRRIFAVARRR